MQSDNIFRDDPEFGHRLKPNLRKAKVVMPGRPHPLPLPSPDKAKKSITKHVTYYCSTNSRGFRGKEFCQHPVPGVIRIIGLGDSITFGHGVNDDECFCARLQEMLSSYGKFDVINAGVHGFTASKILNLLQTEIIDLHPHIVIICTGVMETITQPEHTNPANTILELAPERYQELLSQFHDILMKMYQTTRQHSIKLILLIPPVTSTFPFPDVHRYLNVIRQFAAEKNISMIDLESTFADEEAMNGLVLTSENHIQKLVSFNKGKPTSLITAEVEPGRNYYMAEKIYEFLDKEAVYQRLSITSTHPNANGHMLIAHLLIPVILKELEENN